MKPIKLVYFGTPDFSATILSSLIKDKNIDVVGIVTQPDKPVGRKRTLTTSPVAQVATKNNIPIFKPTKLDQSNLQHIKLLQADIFLVAAHGQITPQSWLDTPKTTTLNIHFSLLPKYRGALCVSESIRNQDQETGVTLMEMDAKLDHGPIILQKKLTISDDDDVATLTKKLTQKAILLISNINSLQDIKSKTNQDHKKAINTPSLKTRTRQSAFIPTLETSNPKKLHALIRSLNPEPGAWTKINGQEIKLLQTKVTNGKLEIITVQIPGKNPISWQQFQLRL